ncbi:MAG: ankyrin repeat domain-containing protein [Wolbachia sp.]
MITDEAKRVRDNTKGVKTVIHEAVYHFQLNIVKFFIEKVGYDVNLRDEGGCTLLFYAIPRSPYDIERSLKIMKYLIKKGADVNATAKAGATVLHIAACTGPFEIVELLIKKGADVNARDNEGNIPLHYSTGGSTLLEDPIHHKKSTNDNFSH